MGSGTETDKEADRKTMRETGRGDRQGDRLGDRNTKATTQEQSKNCRKHKPIYIEFVYKTPDRSAFAGKYVI